MKAAILIFALAMGMICGRARAQVPVSLGDHEAFVGNAGIARQGSSASAYYNPAGLTAVDHSEISASGTLFQQSNRKVTGSLSADSSTFQNVPTQISTIGQYRKYHYAFSVFNTRNFDYATAIGVDVSGIGQVPANVKWTGNTLLVGPSIAMELAKDWSLGFSLFVQKDDEYLNTVARVDETIGGDTYHILGQTEISASAYALVPMVGVMWNLDRDTTLGARWIVPSIAVTGHRKTREQRVGYRVNGGTPTDLGQPQSEDAESAKTARPMEIGFGYATRLPHELRVYVDGSFSFHSKYAPSASADEVTFSDAFGISGGVEWGPKSGAWAAGVLIKQNNLRDDIGEVTDYKGLTVGYVSSSEHFDAGVGLSYVLGSGSAEGSSTSVSNTGLLLTSTYKF